MKNIFYFFLFVIFSCTNLETDLEKVCEISCENLEKSNKLTLISLKYAFDKKENPELVSLKNELKVNNTKLNEIRSKYYEENISTSSEISFDSIFLNKCKSCYVSTPNQIIFSDKKLSNEILSLKSYIVEEIKLNGYTATQNFKEDIPIFNKSNFNKYNGLNVKRKDSFYIGQVHEIKSIDVTLDSKEKLKVHLKNLEIELSENIEDDNIISYSGLLRTTLNSLNFIWELKLQFNKQNYSWEWSRDLLHYDVLTYEPPSSPKIIASELGEHIAEFITNEYWGTSYNKDEVQFDFKVENDKYQKYKGIIDIRHYGVIGSMYPRSYSFGVLLSFDNSWSWELIEL